MVKNKNDRPPGTFLRFDEDDREWLRLKAISEERRCGYTVSVPDLLRKLVADARAADTVNAGEALPMGSEPLPEKSTG